MSAAAEPEPPPSEADAPHVEVKNLRALTPDEMTSWDVRYCDICGDEQIFGCVAALHLGYMYLELCAACFRALDKGVDAVKVAREARRTQ
jgi:hypothetical protein